MTISHEIQRDKKRVITTVNGELTLYHLQTEQAQVWQEPALTGFCELFDLRKSRFNEMFLTEVIQYAGIASQHVPHTRIALLATTEIQQRAANIYASARSFRENRVPCEVFSDEAEALAWLEEA